MKWQDRLEKHLKQLPPEVQRECLKGYQEEDYRDFCQQFDLHEEEDYDPLGALLDNIGDMMKSDAIHALIDIMEIAVGNGEGDVDAVKVGMLPNEESDCDFLEPS